MNDTIASFPSSNLYNDALISAPEVAKRTLLDLPTITDPGSDEVKSTLEPTVVFFDTAGCEYYERNESDDQASIRGIGEGSKSNANEAEIVVRWVKELVDAGVPPEEIAVVTPYQAQVALVSEMISEQYPTMTIGSVDGLQGQEREVSRPSSPFWT
jgi:DNA polymerase alpha-associated DNA helicase A